MRQRSGLNLFNLLMTTLLALAAGAIGVLLMMATAGVFVPDRSFGGSLASLIDELETGDATRTTIYYAIGIAMVMAGFLVLLVQVMLIGRKEPMVLIRESPEGAVRVLRQSIRELAERTMCADRAVVSCGCSLDESDGGLVVECRPKIIMGSDMTKVTTDGQRRTKEAVERLLGIRVREVSVNARYIGARKGRLVAAE
jgi:hypothetical protein